MTSTQTASKAIHLLAAINRQGLKAFNCKTEKSLIFLILNDTVQLVSYNLASLWKVETNKKLELIAVSGQTMVSRVGERVKLWDEEIIHKVLDLKKSQIFQSKDTLRQFTRDEAFPNTNNSFLWLPLIVNDEIEYGILFERWDSEWKYDELEVLDFLGQNYAAALGKFTKVVDYKKVARSPFLYVALGLLAFTLFLKVPLPIVSLCEIVAKDPILITAPLEGVIQKIMVDPGQQVSKGDILFEYDKQIPLSELDVARRQVEVADAELRRTYFIAMKNKEAMEDLGTLQMKLKKDKAQLNLAEYKASQLVVRSPINGVAVINDPDQWRGNLVKIGEKILMVSDPHQTKIKIWIPENDNVYINPEKMVKIVLNTNPDKTYYAKLRYIDSQSTLNDKGTPSFIAEADWSKTPDDVKLGQKGTAVLYGDDVTIFYWLARRPYTYVRNFLGI